MADMINKDGKFYVCEAATETNVADAAAFALLTWVQVKYVVNLPMLGVTDNMVTRDYVDPGLSQQQKGHSVGTAETLTVGYDGTDLGQIALETMAATRSNYPIKRELNDGTIIYSRAVFARSGGITGGGGEDEVNQEYTVNVNQTPIVVAPV